MAMGMGHRQRRGGLELRAGDGQICSRNLREKKEGARYANTLGWEGGAAIA